MVVLVLLLVAAYVHFASAYSIAEVFASVKKVSTSELALWLYLSMLEVEEALVLQLSFVQA